MDAINSIKDYQPTDIRSLWNLGFGTADSLSTLTPRSVISNVLLTNCPQLGASLLYLVLNSLLTRMLLATEWNGYARDRKTLRVSWPKGKQRSSYYLNLPYAYGIPLMIASSSLHWLVSQSFFFVHIMVYDINGNEDTGASISTCGYSIIAIIFGIVLSGLIMLLTLACGCRRYQSEMPLVANCSAAISAACHPPAHDIDASLKPVMWGEFAADEVKAPDGIGHCCFTSKAVTTPLPTRLYS